jgi:hypothetical protein
MGKSFHTIAVKINPFSAKGKAAPLEDGLSFGCRALSISYNLFGIAAYWLTGAYQIAISVSVIHAGNAWTKLVFP